MAFDSGDCPLDIATPITVTIDQTKLTAPRPASDRSWQVSLHRADGQWKIGSVSAEGLRKKHDFQGPIDDAFLDSFIFVRPTGEGRHKAVDQWVNAEFTHAVEHWRRQFRGEARVKDDKQIQDDDIAKVNLILFGDPASNAVLARIADKLPIAWNEKEIVTGKERFGSDNHALIAIYPNPLNPARYVVLNSSFTYREFAYLNNARQVPMLPDWAVVDLRTPPDAVWPGKVVAADFFDEQWRLRAASAK